MEKIKVPLLCGGRGWKCDLSQVRFVYTLIRKELEGIENFYEQIVPHEYQRQLLGEFDGKKEGK